MSSETATYLNLGCGSRYHPDWVNIDTALHGPGVIQHDISRGIPYPDDSCDVVYHAAVLEHLRRPDAEALLTECQRVLKPGGIVRIGVPDLEKICQLYLSSLTDALNGDECATHDYDWIMLELYDQTVREKSGGGMVDCLRQNPLPNAEFIYQRIGEEGRQIVEGLRSSDESQELASKSSTRPGLLRKLHKRVRALPGAARQRAFRLLLGAEGMRALAIGRFRLAGEVHHWMYDRYSLARLLRSVGFHYPQVQDANTSQIPDWAHFHLDTLPDGTPIKPDLFFMEAIKPHPNE
jgi:SAM-dependent methyltransferase